MDIDFSGYDYDAAYQCAIDIKSCYCTRMMYLLINLQEFGLSIFEAYVKSHPEELSKLNFKGWSALAIAVRNAGWQKDYLTAALILIEAGANPNSTDEDGYTPLMIAASYARFESSIDLMHLLLDRGADPNIKSKRGWSALMLATCYCNEDSSLEAVKILLERGADIELRDAKNFSALSIAISTDSLKTFTNALELLLAFGADPNRSQGLYDNALILAIDYGNLEAVKLLAPQVDINATHGSIKYTALMYAVEHATHELSLQIIREMLNLGANVDQQDDKGNTALMHLICAPILECTGEILKLFVEHKVNMEISNKMGLTPLMFAFYNSTESKMFGIMQQLLSHGANPDTITCTGSIHGIHSTSIYYREPDIHPQAYLHAMKYSKIDLISQKLKRKLNLEDMEMVHRFFIQREIAKKTMDIIIKKLNRKFYEASNSITTGDLLDVSGYSPDITYHYHSCTSDRWSKLMYLILNLNLYPFSAVETYIKTHHEELNHQNSQGYTALMIAVIGSAPKITALESQDSAIIIKPNKSSLFSAIHLKYAKIVEILLNHSADPDIYTHHGQTAIHIAAEMQKHGIYIGVLDILITYSKLGLNINHNFWPYLLKNQRNLVRNVIIDREHTMHARSKVNDLIMKTHTERMFQPGTLRTRLFCIRHALDETNFQKWRTTDADTLEYLGISDLESFRIKIEDALKYMD